MFVFLTQIPLNMPVKSYLAHPLEGKKDDLALALSKFNECEVTSATNQDVLIVVTDTEDDNADNLLKENIEKIDSLKLLALVSGFNTSKI